MNKIELLVQYLLKDHPLVFHLLDNEYEFQMVGMNRRLDPGIETVFLMAGAEHQAIASKLVKEIARLGGDVSPFVSDSVEAALKSRLGR